MLNHSTREPNYLIFNFTSPGFALLSGWLFIKNFKHPTAKLKNILKILIPLHIAGNAIYYCLKITSKYIWIYVGATDLFTTTTNTTNTLDFIKLITIQPINAPLWFLRDLILASTTTALICKINRKLWLPVFGGLFILLCTIDNRLYCAFMLGIIIELLSTKLNIDNFLTEFFAADHAKSILNIIFLLITLLILNQKDNFHLGFVHALSGLIIVLIFSRIKFQFKPEAASNLERFSVITFVSHYAYIALSDAALNYYVSISHKERFALIFIFSNTGCIITYFLFQRFKQFIHLNIKL